MTLRVSGLAGGHSGVEIDKGRANANLLLGRLLRAASGAAEVRLVSAAGGSKDNAIPAAAEAVPDGYYAGLLGVAAALLSVVVREG